MAHRLLRVIAVLGLVSNLLTGVARADEVKAAVAANFSDVTKALAPLFKQKTGHELVASFGASGKLVSQIENGAPFEIFLSADAQRPERLAQNGYGIADTRFTYAIGKLVLWSSDARVKTAGAEILKSGAFKRLAVANPKTAPYGLAANEVMQHLGLLETLTPKLVYGDSITQVWQFAASGNVDLAFVALSQAQGSENEKRGSFWPVPQTYYTPLTQDAILLRPGTGKPAARAFLAFLRSSEARTVIERFGYTAP